jgi:hypothetical protein
MLNWLRTWKDAVAELIEALSRNLSSGTKEKKANFLAEMATGLKC